MYYFGAALSLMLQIGLIVHVFRNGKDRFWIYLIFFIPVAGSLAYFLLEVLPDLRHSRAANSTGRIVSRVVNPGGKQRQLEAQLAACNTVANKLALAAALLENKQFSQAIELLEGARAGIYQNDPKIMASLGQAYFQAKHFDQALTNYRSLLAHHPDLMSARDYLHLAIACQECEKLPEAETNFRTALAKSGSFEIKYRFAMMLLSTGRGDEGNELLAEILRLAKVIPTHALRLERPWIKAAEAALTLPPNQ